MLLMKSQDATVISLWFRLEPPLSEVKRRWRSAELPRDRQDFDMRIFRRARSIDRKSLHSASMSLTGLSPTQICTRPLIIAALLLEFLLSGRSFPLWNAPSRVRTM